MARMYPPQLDLTDEHIPTSEHKVYTAFAISLMKHLRCFIKLHGSVAGKEAN